MGQSSGGVRGGLYKVSEWVMRFSLTNLQWMVFNIPVAFILLSMLDTTGTGELIYLLPILAILIPPVFFPATTAMFAKAREWVRQDEDERPTKSYFRYYKENYKVSLGAGVFFTLLWGILVADVYYFSKTNELMMNVFLVIAILLFVYTVNFFSVVVHYNLKLGKVLKQAFFVTIASPVLFITVAITSSLMLYISLYIFPLLIPVFTGSIIAFLAFSAFYRLYMKVSHKKET